MTSHRTQERQRRRQLYEQLRLQSEILCDSYRDDHKANIVLNRMMLTILDIVGRRSITNVKRQALADHFTDCAVDTLKPSVQLGGGEDRNNIYLDGAFNISDLAKRISWSETRTGQTIDVEG